ncbi:hypothetical protein BDDG_12005 [Blastomyces dermatitidis ATCC 18188]|uniref:Uncharacterized protein n=1 Tax=Ajellomyces dermatitidis (strain ATCC 18188 / CBS 674.68) TaxID=653446 RepID=A0A0J9HDX1_AJEDA|nr:hypothetical protein BDDG_12005 [Blastomyces dermatitidis ATCC 18188]
MVIELWRKPPTPTPFCSLELRFRSTHSHPVLPSDSQAYTQASAEKHAIVIAEVWKNEDGRYGDLKQRITPYYRIKADGLLAMGGASAPGNKKEWM